VNWSLAVVVLVVLILVAVLLEYAPKFGGALLFILVFALLARGVRQGHISARA
jgi:hypothetical protein